MEQKMKTTVGDMVRLDVGGKMYTTSLTTLTRYPDSMLGAMFSGRVPVQTDDNGTYLIDRDGELFRYVLNFLRTSQLCLPEEFMDYGLLICEADFYQLDALKEDVIQTLKYVKAERKRQLLETDIDETGIQVIELECWETNDANIRFLLNAPEDIIRGLPSLMQHAYEGVMGGELDECWNYECSHYGQFEFAEKYYDIYGYNGDELPLRSTITYSMILEDLEELGFKVIATSCRYNEENLKKKLRWACSRKVEPQVLPVQVK
ncbi:BTB/POZ domain-containing protein KCTD1-like [Ptychodera flava]|uniref:BTB/POZ domain-containing protein KCTD1-like n=1 Tax=Ptychodera flava TaxID=63121 RepID=UPI00396A6EF7